jgi:hypothetical protein
MQKPISYFHASHKPQHEVTLYMDTTFIPTKQGNAPVNYQEERSNDAFNVYCPELDMII